MRIDARRKARSIEAKSGLDLRTKTPQGVGTPACGRAKFLSGNPSHNIIPPIFSTPCAGGFMGSWS